MEVLMVRAWADRKPATQTPVTVSFVDPGYCKSRIHRFYGNPCTQLITCKARARDLPFALKAVQTIIDPISARTTEQGSCTLVHAAGAGAESHGRYMSNRKVPPVAPLVKSAVGCQMQNRV